MATYSLTLNKEKILRRTHIEQLLSYVEEREKEEWYYGNKKQFEKRHEEIKNLLMHILELTNES